MTQRLVLVDYENIQKIDLSILDDSYRAIVFVGAQQNLPKAARKPMTAHRFSRVDFQKIDGAGKNALDFHIAFQLGRTIEVAPATECFVLSRDKGFDPLLSHLNKSGLKCRRISCLTELLPQPAQVVQVNSDEVCHKCGKASTIEHHGGRWCSNCGCFSKPADPDKLPSNQRGYRESTQRGYEYRPIMAECGWCYQKKDMSGGIYDDGEWMCGDCIARYAR